MRKVYISPDGEKQYNRPESIVIKDKSKSGLYIYSPSDSQLQAAGWKIEEEAYPEPKHDESKRREKKNRIYELKALLQESDYKAIKFAEGELSAEEYEPTRLQRRAWREEINVIESELAEEGE